ncbi:MAG: ATPase, T2SS/T4P/T4SS family [Gammaproteobacteria bacterium]
MNAVDDTVVPKVMRSRIGVMTYLAPRGVLTDEPGIDELKAAVQACMEARETQIVIDLGMIQRLNSAALEALLEIQQQLVRMGGWLKVAKINALIRDIFNITGVSEYISVIDSESEADAPASKESDNNKGRLGDILVAKGLITEEQIVEAIRLQKKFGKRMGQIIIDKGWVPEHDVLASLAQQLNVPFITLRSGIYDPEIVEQLDKETTARLKLIPLFKVRGELTLATSDPQDFPSFDEVEERLGCRVRPVLARREDILKTINEAYSSDAFSTEMIIDVDEDFEVVENAQPDDFSAIDEMAAGSPVINLVNSIIQRAVQDGASDIHIEPSRTKSRVRFRIDGVLYEVMTPRVELHPALISRLKVMANLDIAERRLPQDGRIQVHTQGRAVDLRFSSLPGLYGEKVVLRVLDKNQSILDVNRLGMTDENIVAFKKLLDRSYGLILVTGPTGSGKTTSLYAALNYLNSIEKNIVTIEDPVEYQVEIINQNEVRDKIGLSFAKVLKHVLRQDPDIIMVGEIRERETAEIAVQAALTGHLVLSTLHTNDSVGAVSRMIDMGVEPYMLSSALIGVIAQRLVRTICPACKTNYLATPEIVKRYGWEDNNNIRLSKGRGCPECYDSGYRGRMAIHEILQTDEALQRLIVSNPSRDELNAYLQERKLKTLFDDGLDRVLNNVTTIEEIARVINT